MKQHLLPALKLTILCLIIFCVFYPLIIWGIAQAAPNQGKGEVLTKDGKTVGYKLIGQSFTKPEYFWGRPSAVGYNAAGSAGSNKGPSNPDYLKDVSNRIDSLLKYHPYLKRSEIPADMITASGSGLDPNISVEAANMQVKRVAEFRKLDEKILASLVEKNTTKPLLGLFGPKAVNVLQLNLALNELRK